MFVLCFRPAIKSIVGITIPPLRSPTEPWRTLDDLEGAEITSLAVSPDNQQLYVGVYQPQASGLNGSFYLLNCNTGKNEGDSPYLNVAYKPLKVVYKPR